MGAFSRNAFFTDSFSELAFLFDADPNAGRIFYNIAMFGIGPLHG